jgi:hypothetical protein
VHPTKGSLVLRRQNVRLTYANVVGSLALFVALGGTAAAAVTLPRDSVGSREIASDAVRAPEIAKDAVRPPEIDKGAVRSSEIRDSGILLTDLSEDARSALRGANVRIAEADEVQRVPLCPGTDLRDCANLVELSLGSTAPDEARDWLIQAKMTINTPDATAFDFNNSCGLVQADDPGAKAVIDDVRVGSLHSSSEPMIVALSGVVRQREQNPLMAVRCTMPQFDEIDVEDLTITAIEVAQLTGP